MINRLEIKIMLLDIMAYYTTIKRIMSCHLSVWIEWHTFSFSKFSSLTISYSFRMHAIYSPSHYCLSILLKVSITAPKHHDQKVIWERKGLFDLQFCIGVQDRNSNKAWADTERLKGCCLLACFPSNLGWALPHWSQNEKMSYSCISLRHSFL